MKVSDEEILGRIAQMAAERGVRPDKMRKELMRRNQIGFVAQQIREHKALDAVVARAKVTEVTPEEFAGRLADGAATEPAAGAAKGKPSKEKNTKKTPKKKAASKK